MWLMLATREAKEVVLQLALRKLETARGAHNAHIRYAR